jgi:DNA-binding NtrC family response regulator
MELMNTINSQDFLDFCYHLLFRSYQHVILYQQISPHDFLKVYGMLEESGKCYLNTDKYEIDKPIDRVTDKFTLQTEVHRNCIAIVNCSRFNQLSELDTNDNNNAVVYDPSTNSHHFYIHQSPSILEVNCKLTTSFESDISNRSIKDAEDQFLIKILGQELSTYLTSLVKSNQQNRKQEPSGTRKDKTPDKIQNDFIIAGMFLQLLLGKPTDELDYDEILDTVYGLRELSSSHLTNYNPVVIPKFSSGTHIAGTTRRSDQSGFDHYSATLSFPESDAFELKYFVANPFIETVLGVIERLKDYEFLRLCKSSLSQASQARTHKVDFTNLLVPKNPLDYPFYKKNSRVKYLTAPAKFKFKTKIIADSHIMDSVLTEIETYSSIERVLITGESGVGKEGVARAIHILSGRIGGFEAVNVAGISHEAQESALFGTEGGVFTGVEKTVFGAIEKADGGTLFLDEIGDIDANLQQKLLRCLQEGKLNRMGSTNEIDVDFQLVSATNKDIDKEVIEGEMRADFVARISGAIITIPPLRFRKADILPLSYHFFTSELANWNELGFKLTEKDFEKLTEKDWKSSNVRELKNHIKRVTTFIQYHFDELSRVSRDVFVALIKEPSAKNLMDDEFRVLSPEELKAVRTLIKLKSDNVKSGLLSAANTLDISREKFTSQLNTALILIGDQFNFNTDNISQKLITISTSSDSEFQNQIKEFVKDRFKSIILDSKKQNPKTYLKSRIDSQTIKKLIE